MNRQLWLWHRRFGAAAAVMVILLCITGVALNHTERLGLDRRHVSADWILGWYGIRAPEAGESIHTPSHEITLFGDQLYVDDRPVGAPFQRLAGAVETGRYLAVAAGEEVILLTDELELVERLGDADGVPPDIRGLALADDGTVVALDGAHTVWAADAELIGWRPVTSPAAANWPGSEPASAARVAALADDYRGRILTLERLLLDLHSGRLFGPWGPWLMDAVAVMTLVLAFSGLWLWTRSRS